MKANEHLIDSEQNRRQSMLPELQRQLRRIHQRRRRLRVVVPMVCVLALLGLAGWLNLPHVSRSQSTNVVDNRAEEESPSSASDSHAIAPAGFVGRHVTFEYIDDQELLVLLEEAGAPSFLARIDGELVVLPRRKHDPNGL